MKRYINKRFINLEDGKLFGPKITRNITNDDFFIDCYIKAAKETNEIINSVNQPDYKNKNIIAFLGDRGQGKSSVMRSFGLVLELLNNKDVNFGKNIINSFQVEDYIKGEFEFINLDIIDPSTFEECNDVIDIILGRMLETVLNAVNTHSFEQSSEKINKMKIKFDKLYECLSIIKNKDLLNMNYEFYEGSIDALLTISEVSNFKRNLKSLIEDYLDIVKKTNKEPILVIMIDDIDIDISNSYDTIEKIRKYLNLPRVLILMAAKLEQLHEGIRIEKMKALSNASTVDSIKIYDDVYETTTKYLLKLLPQNRRIHLPNILDCVNDLRYNILISCIGSNREKESQNIKTFFIDLIYMKTKILLLESNQIQNYLISGNLREIVDLYACLSDMQTVNSEYINEEEKINIYLTNLEKFKDYFLNNWCTNNLHYSSARIIRKLYYEGSIFKNHSLIQKLADLSKDNSTIFSSVLKQRGKNELCYDLSDISNLLNELDNHQCIINVINLNKTLFGIKFCYTILMNQLGFIDSLKSIEYYSLSKMNQDLIGEDASISEGYLLSFVGGRILNQDKFTDKPTITDENNYSILTPPENIKVPNNLARVLIMLLLSITNYDENKDIYYYNYRNKSFKIYLDPLLIFVNCLNLRYVCQYLYQDKFKIYVIELLNINEDEYSDTIGTVEDYLNQYIKSLEFVAKLVISNFEVYDFYVDWMWNHYFRVEPSLICILEALDYSRIWLTILRNDLIKSKIKPDPENDVSEIIYNIDEVSKFLTNLIKNDGKGNLC